MAALYREQRFILKTTNRLLDSQSLSHTNTGEAVSYQVNTIADIASTEDSFDNENDVEYDRE